MATDPHCDPLCEKLSAYIDRELPEELRLRVAAHIASCSRCKALHDDLDALIRCCAQLDEEQKVPDDVHAGLMVLLEREMQERT